MGQATVMPPDEANCLFRLLIAGTGDREVRMLELAPHLQGTRDNTGYDPSKGLVGRSGELQEHDDSTAEKVTHQHCGDEESPRSSDPLNPSLSEQLEESEAHDSCTEHSAVVKRPSLISVDSGVVIEAEDLASRPRTPDVEVETPSNASSPGIECDGTADETALPLNSIREDIVSWTLTSDYNEDKPILMDASSASLDRYVTKKKALKIIGGLTGAFVPQSVVCMHLENDITYPLIYHGILASGCTWTGTNIAYRTRELAHHLRTSNAKYVIVEAKRAQIVSQAIQSAEIDAEIILYTDLLDVCEKPDVFQRGTFQGCRRLHDLLDSQGDSRTVPMIDVDAVATLSSTSGTTGLPKMAARTYAALLAEAKTLYDRDHEKPYNVRRLYCTPIFHAFSAPMMLMAPLKFGNPTYFMKRYDDSFVSKIFQFGITETAAVPTILKRLSDLPAEQRPLLQSLRRIWCAGAQLGDNAKKCFLDVFDDPNRVAVIQCWGMTEGGWFSSFPFPEVDTSGSVGRMMPGYSVKIDSTHTTIDAFGVEQEVGEILVRAPQLTHAYVGNVEATRKAFDESCFLRTGDVGYRDSRGRMFIVDRAKDLIKVNGWQVSPSELQNVLLGCPLVRDAAVVGAGPPGEEFAAVFVVPQTGHDDGPATAGLVKAYLKAECASYKVAGCSVALVQELPLGNTGKVDVKALKMLL